LTWEDIKMKTAAVSKLKASLSEYLSKVKAGEEVVVTDRGKPIAKLVPMEPSETIPEHLKELERKGLITVGTGRLPKDFWDLPRPKDPKGLALRALLEERREGR
jgi:prevent-host-death family protein